MVIKNTIAINCSFPRENLFSSGLFPAIVIQYRLIFCEGQLNQAHDNNPLHAGWQSINTK